MELSALKFAADTTELERASKVIAGLVTDVAKLDKVSRDAAQTEAILAKAAKSNADANLQNAKAQDVRLKSTIAADKADKANEQAVVKKTKAIEKETEATTKNVGVLQKQKDILEFQTQGYSKGQAGILAYGKAAGLAASDIAELGKVLETQRKLMGGDPFDKSLSGIKSLQNQYTELKESLRQYNTDSELSAKQTRELARDKERLIEKMKVEGASFQDIRKAVRAHNDEYVNLAGQYNKLASAEDVVVKSRKEAVAATNYLTQADQKLAAALNTSNAAIDKAGTDSLVKYENALRKSGVSQDVATSRLGAYKAQLVQVQALEEKRRSQHLARAITPQISDVVVSLWSGQSPFTVLLQQGAQVNDLFQLSGVAAEDFGKTVKQAFTSMIPAIMTVVKGVGGLIVDGFMAAGTAVVNFAGKITGLNGVMDAGAMKLKSMGFDGFAATVQSFGKVGAPIAAGSILVLVAALTSLAVAFKNALKEGAELSRNLELTGASLGLTKSAAIDLAQSLATSERPVAKSVELISELAKVGKFSAENIKLVNDAAIDLERYGKVSIAETAKELAKLREDPVKALIEVAEKTGYVTLETIENIKSLREQGKMAEAAELAMKAWASSSSSAASSIKNQMSPLEQVWDSMLSKINRIIGRLQDLARGSGLAEQIADKEAQLASVKGGFFTSTFGLSPKGAKDVDRLSEEIYMLKLQLQAETDITKERAKRSSAAAQLKAETEATKEYTTAIEKQAGKEATLSEFVKKALEERTRSVASALSKNIEDVKLSAETIDKITKGAELQWKEMQKKPKKDPSENYYATLMREATNNTIAATNAVEELTKSELKLLEVKADPRFASLNALQKQDIANKYEAAIAAEKQAKAVEDVDKAEQFRLKILGKSEGITKEYYGQIKALEEHAVKAGWSREQIEELTRAIFNGTPVMRDYNKAIEDVRKATFKFNEENIAYEVANTKQNNELEFRIALLGKTEEQQRLMNIENQRGIKLKEVDIRLSKQLREIDEEITEAQKRGLTEDGYNTLIAQRTAAERNAAEERKNINREVAVQAAEDFDAEFRKIKEGVTDSIVTALFEGGKAGSKKLRDVLVSVLRQKVTMVVDVGVNAFMNSLIGGSAGSVAGSAGSSILSSLATSVGGSALTSSLGISGLFTGGAVTAASNAALGASLGLGSSSAAAAASGAAVAGGTSAGVAGAASSLGTTLAAIPGWGWAIAGIAALGSIFSKKSTPHRGGASTYSAAAGLSNTNLDAVNSIGFSARNDAGIVTFTNQIAKTLTEVFDSTAVAFGKTAGYEITAAFADDTSKDGAWGQLRIKQGGQSLVDWSNSQTSKWAPKVFADGEAGQKEYFAAIALSARDALKTAIGEVSWASEMLDALGISPTIEQLSTAVNQINTYQTALLALNKNIIGFADYSDKSISALARLSGGMDVLIRSAAAYYDNFYTEAEKTANVTRDITAALSKVGLEMPTTRDGFRALVEQQMALGDSGLEAVKTLLGVSGAFSSIVPAAEEAASAINEVMNSLKAETEKLEVQLLYAQGRTPEADAAQRSLDTQGFTEAEIAVYDYNQSLRHQITAINEASNAINEASNAISKLASDVADLFAARNSAGSLLDKIAGAMGNQGSFASQREGELWSALAGTSDYKKQVELSSQLTDIVLERQRIEVQNAEKLLNFGRGLRDYVNGLKLSDLSPLTNAEKLAEASKQYSETLSKAISGDANAQAGLQSISSSYLELARTYYAGNEQFVDIFNSVTSSLDTLGINSMTESQQQLAIGNQSLSELQKLYGITETAYQALNTQYESSLSQLEAQKNALILQADSLTQLRSIAEILYGLPAEISARIGGGRSYFQDNPDVAAAYLQNNYGLSEKDYSFEHYLKYGKDEGRELPSFAKGIDYVPYDMTANIHQGERVLTKLENRNYSKLTSASDNSELVNAIKSLQAQVEKLEASNREDARMQASTYVGASQAAASTIAAATTKAARTTELKQGATIK